MDDILNFISKFLSTIILASQITGIISAGVLGGIISYYLENETQISDKKKRMYQVKRHVYLGIGAAFLVPLFLWITQSEIRTKIGNDSSSFLVFIGFCLIAAISAKKFIQTLSNRILKDIKEIKKKTEEIEENAEKQYVNDARAMALVDKQLMEGKFSDEGKVEITKEEFKNMISSASRGSRIMIFEKARTFRIINYRNKELTKNLQNAIPVFEALIEGDKDKKFHRNHAQLAYIQKDKEPSDYAEAIKQLDLAIEKRDKQEITGFLLYEFNRGICRIMTDPGYIKGKHSSESNKKLIIADLKKAAKIEYWKNSILNSAKDNRNVCISKWMGYNKIKNKDISS